MSIWHIYGGNRLTGSTQVQGAKNAVLPIMAASVLAGSETVLHNVPDLKDVTITLTISAARRSATGTRCTLIPAA